MALFKLDLSLLNRTKSIEFSNVQTIEDFIRNSIIWMIKNIQFSFYENVNLPFDIAMQYFAAFLVLTLFSCTKFEGQFPSDFL